MLGDLITECSACLAEQSGAWTKAATYWRRIGNHERADEDQKRGIESLPNALERGFALMKYGDHTKAIEAFEAAGSRDWAARCRALLCEGRREWEQAADLWQSINDPVNHARAMAQAARSREDWTSAAEWHRAAKQKTLMADAERRARAQVAEQSVAISHRQPGLF